MPRLPGTGGILIERPEESCQGLAAAGGCSDEHVVAGFDERPALNLYRRGLVEAVCEPLPNARMELRDRAHRC